MRLYRHFADYHDRSQGIALAVGNFDGFHQGHKAVIDKMLSEAAARSLESAVMIFEPQPLEFFGRTVPPRLYTLRDKIKAFKQAGLDLVFCVSFTKAFCSLAPEEFVELLYRLNVKTVVVGSLFSFGHNGAAEFPDLKRLCAHRGIEAFAINAVSSEGQRISSTMIRALLNEGQLDKVEQLLGRPFSMSGRVVRGQMLGRKLGFPTANVNLLRKVSPLDGVFAVQVKTPYGVFDGVANVGNRPTVNGTHSLLEVNLFDFSADLYGREIEVYFIAKLRAEHKFADLDALKEQLRRDCAQAAQVLQQRKIQVQAR